MSSSEDFNISYFFERLYFGYRFGAFRAILKLYMKILKLASTITGSDLLIGYGKKALDLGCGLGISTQLLSLLGYTTIGIDISEVIKKRHEIDSQLCFIMADALFSPFKSNVFDLVVSFDLFEHLSNPSIFLSELWRVVKDSGIIVLTASSRSSIRRVYDALQREKTHINMLTSVDVKKLFSKLFKRVVVINRLLLPIPPHFFNRYFIVLDVPKQLADGYIVIAREKRELVVSR